MTKVLRKRGRTTKTRSFYYPGFFLIFVFWVASSALCYTGIIVFDSRTFDGAIILGLGLTASVYGVIEFLKRLYDDGTTVFRKRDEQ
jgi:hypothetical protein